MSQNTDGTDRVDRLPDPADPRGRGPQTTSRERQNRMAEDVAAQLDIDREGVGTVDRIKGLDVFLRSEGAESFGEQVASDFASEADYVQPTDVAPNVDAEDITAAPTVAQARRDDVAERARTQAASDDEFARPGDFEADVGERGVSSLGFSAAGERRRAGRALEADAPLESVDPQADLTATDDGGFELDAEASRRSAARGFEDDYDVLGQGSLGAGDVRETSGGFGLAEQPAREVAAAQLDSQYPEVDIAPGDVSLSLAADGSYEASFSTEVQQ